METVLVMVAVLVLILLAARVLIVMVIDHPMFTVALCVLVLLVLNTGCAELPKQLPPSELVWQALHAGDVAQTNQIAKNPDCYREANTVTSRLIGEHPGQGDVLAWGIGTAVLHGLITVWLENADVQPWVRTAWATVSIGATGYTVADNMAQGIGFTGSDSCY